MIVFVLIIISNKLFEIFLVIILVKILVWGNVRVEDCSIRKLFLDMFFSFYIYFVINYLVVYLVRKL